MTDAILKRGYDTVRALHLRTKNGKVDWQPSDNDKAFQADFEGFRLVIQEVPDSDYPDKPDYHLNIVNNLGQTIETISNVTLRSLSEEPGRPPRLPNPYNLLSETFEMARRKAFGVDAALEAILRQLKEE